MTTTKVEHTNETCHYDDEHSCEQVATLEAEKAALEKALKESQNETRGQIELKHILEARSRTLEDVLRRAAEDETGLMSRTICRAVLGGNPTWNPK